jgi:CBS domain-containing protein
MDWVVWVVVAGLVVLVGVAYLAGRRRARQVLAGRSMEPILSTEVRALMSTPPKVVPEGTTLEDAARIMLEKQIGCLPVVGGDGLMVGLVTESDLSGSRPWLSLRAWAKPSDEGDRPAAPDLDALRNIPVDEVMTRRVVTAAPGEALSVVVDRMMTEDLHHIPVVESGAPVGVLTRHDLLGFLARRT